MTGKTDGPCCSGSSRVKEIDEYIDELAQGGSLDGKLITILHRAQEMYGYLPKEVLTLVAGRLSMPVAKVYGVVSFYSFFSMEPKGKYEINVCMGTACFVSGADRIAQEFEKHLGIKAGQTTQDCLFTMNELRCVGACGLAPVVVVNGKLYGKVACEDVGGIIEAYRGGAFVE